MFLFLLALLLLCYCITHGPPGSVRAAATARQPPPLLCDSHRWCFRVYVYVCALLYVPGMCEWSVCCHKPVHESSSSTAAAVQRQPCFKLLPLCQLSRCVWLEHSRRSNHGDIITSNATIKHTSSDLIQGIRSIYSSSNQQVAHTYEVLLERLCFPFPT